MIFIFFLICFSFYASQDSIVLGVNYHLRDGQVVPFGYNIDGFQVAGAACSKQFDFMYQQDGVHVAFSNDTGAFGAGVFNDDTGEIAVRALTGQNSLLNSIFSNLSRSLVDIFQEKNKQILKSLQDYSASNAVVSLIYDKKLRVAHCGRSRAIVFNCNGDIVYETTDHCPIHEIDRLDRNYNEKLGIIYKNHKDNDYNKLCYHSNKAPVEPYYAIWESRSFGHENYQSCGLIVDPDVKEINLPDQDLFVLQFSKGMTLNLMTQAVQETNKIKPDDNIQDITLQAKDTSKRQLEADSDFNQKLVKVIVGKINEGESCENIVKFFMQSMGNVQSLDPLNVDEYDACSKNNVSLILYKILKDEIGDQYLDGMNETSESEQTNNNNHNWFLLIKNYKNVVISGIVLCLFIFTLYRLYSK